MRKMHALAVGAGLIGALIIFSRRATATPGGPPTVLAYNASGSLIGSQLADPHDAAITINQALQSVPGGKVVLTQARYPIMSQIVPISGVGLEGQGESTVIFLKDGANITPIGGNVNNVVIRGLCIDGNSSKQTLVTDPGQTWPSIWLVALAGSGNTVDSVKGINGLQGGIWMGNGDTIKILQSVLVDCVWRGVTIDQATNAEISDNALARCGRSDSDGRDTAINAFQAPSVKILRNTIDGGGNKAQILLWDSAGAIIDECTFLNGLFMGIQAHSDGAQILRNNFFNTADNAIDPAAATGLLIDGNIIDIVTGAVECSGICANTSNSIIRNNVISRCARAGIHVGPGNNNNQILANIIKNCGTRRDGDYGGIWLQCYAAGLPIAGTKILQNNRCFDDQGTPSQQYGLAFDTQMANITGLDCEGNDFRNNGKGGISGYSASRVTSSIIRNNQGSPDLT